VLVLQRWQMLDPSKVFADMYDLCVSVKLYKAARKQDMDACCGSSTNCFEQACRLQSSWRQRTIWQYSERYWSPVLKVYHWRAPDWFNKLNWSIPEVEVQPVKFAQLPYTQQVSKIIASRGLLGFAGSGMSHSVWLPPGSFMLNVLVLERPVPNPFHSQCCMSVFDESSIYWELRYKSESAGYVYDPPAVHSGLTGLFWRWCKPHINNASSGFGNEQAQAVLKLVLSLDANPSSSGRACMVLDTNYTSPGWPRCDMDAVIPTTRCMQDCTIGTVGLPYNFQIKKADALPLPCNMDRFW